MPRMKGAELITEYLIANDIPYVFGICGHGNVGMLDPLYEARDRITLISPRHEQVAAHMADAYFRVRHKPVATLTSCGPGSCNIIMPLACALSDSSALLAITANVPTSQFNRSPFQEINKHFQADFVNIVRPVVKRSFQPTRVDMLPLALRQAMTTMLSGRPGPVARGVSSEPIAGSRLIGRRSTTSRSRPRSRRSAAPMTSLHPTQPSSPTSAGPIRPGHRRAAA